MFLLRLLPALALALLISLGLFWVMQLLIAPPDDIVVERREFKPLEISRAVREEPEDPVDDADERESGLPPALPSAPNFDVPGSAVIATPTAIVAPIPNAKMKTQVSGGLTLGGGFGNSFGGFTGGSGAGLSGFGSGKGFSGKSLIPLATARPQIPKDAYERGIEGWVEIVFVVTRKGKVRNIRIINAQPRGVFEAAMVEATSRWIYPKSNRSREVKQRFDFKLEDYRDNW